MLTRNPFIRFFSIIALFSIIICSSAAFGDYAPGKIMIKFKPGVLETPRGMRIAAVKTAAVKAASVRALNAKHGVVRIKQLYKEALEARPKWTHLSDKFVLYVPEDKDILEVIKDYEKDPNVIAVSRVGRVRAFVTNPDDTHFVNNNQYGLINIKAPYAWDRTTGSGSVVIAVLDTGINYNHEDFVGRVDTANDKDFVNGDNNSMDDNGHGTAVSGVIGAATNNGKGVAGVDWQAQILPIKVLDSEGYGDMDDIVDGIVHAISNGADVINMSFGQYNRGNDKYVEEHTLDLVELKDRCQDAYQAEIVLVVAAGNGNVDWITYPAYYPTVISVAAVGKNDVRSYWGGIDRDTGLPQASNYADWIDVSAPGTAIWSTRLNGGYDGLDPLGNGTSLACPFVAGLAGLVKAANPSFNNQQIMDEIITSADNVDGLNPGYVGKLGSGRINAFVAVAGIKAQISSPENNDYVNGRVNIYGTATGWDFSNYVLEALQGGSFVETIEASSISVESGGILGTWETASVNGEHTLRLRVISTSIITEEAQINIIVDNITPEANIAFPANGQTVEGQVSISGTAKDQYLDRYLLEYGEGDSPSSFERIKESYISVDGGVLGTWETAGLEGIHTLRLMVYDKVGHSAAQSIRLDIRSTPPTKEVVPQPGLPLTYALPNPFDRGVTTEVTLNYTLEGNFNTKIYLFDLSGNLIWQKSFLSGENGGKSEANNPAWDGRNLFGENVLNGVYVYQIVADQRVIARSKIIVLN